MALAATSRVADPITAQAIAGSPGQFDAPAADFTLTSQDGRQVSLSSLRGKVVLLTFLDPVHHRLPAHRPDMWSADLLGGQAATQNWSPSSPTRPTCQPRTPRRSPTRRT